MNFNFNSSKRKVSLGGNSRVAETREQVLRRTHVERERRARERLKQKSALSIQSSWRRAAAVRDAKSSIKRRWVETLGPHGEYLHTLQDTRKKDAALREVLFFTDWADLADVQRLAAVARDCVRSIGPSGVPVVIHEALGSGKHALQVQLLRLAKLVTLCARSLRHHSAKILPEAADSTPELQSVGKALLLTLVRVLDPLSWQQAGLEAKEILRKLCGMLGARGFFHHIAHILVAASMGNAGDQAAGAARGGVASTSAPSQSLVTRQTAAAPTQSVAAVSAVAAMVAATAGCAPSDSQRQPVMLTPLLCTPLLWNQCPGLKAVAAEIWLRGSTELGAVNSPIDLLPDDLGNGRAGAATALLGNLAEALNIAPLDKLAGPSAAAAGTCFAHAAVALLTHIPLGLLYPTALADEELDEDTVMEDAASASTVDWNESHMSAEAAGAQLKKLVSLVAVKSLLQVMLPPEQVPGSRDRARALCQLFSVPLATPGLQNETRLALALNSELVPRLWHSHLKEGFRAGRWEGEPEPQDEAADPGWMLPLVITCQCFSAFLVTSAESSFYEQQRPLALAELYRSDGSSFLGLLKYALWQILWVEQTRRLQAVSSAAENLRRAARAAAGGLLRQLYDRNCRRQFAPTEAFHVAQLSGDLFQAEVQRSLARGEFLEAENQRVWLVLRHAPFLVPFQIRAAAFQQVVAADRALHHRDRSFLQPPTTISIRRDQLFWDSFEQLNGMGQGLKERLQITFVDVHGMQEAGVDGGGLFKDLMENLVKEGFDPQLGLFLPTSDNRLYPNPNAGLAMEDAIAAFEFLGRIVGKVMYEGIIVELPLAPFFLKQLLRRGVDVNDLATLDEELYRNLMFLRSYTGDFDDLALTFTITRDIYGDHQERELIPGGRNIAVTHANRAEYVLRTANYRLNVETRQWTDAFRRGLYEMIEPAWISMFNEEELQSLIRGRGTAGIDLAELRENVNYAGGYHEDHPTIRAFWEALASFTPQQQAAWLKFVTACSRAPLLGFKHLSPQLCISKAGDESDRLPTSATCMNLLKLPPSDSAKHIADKLLFAIENVSGFDLS